MHFISLVAVEMPKIKENQAENQEVEKCLEELREAYAFLAVLCSADSLVLS